MIHVPTAPWAHTVFDLAAWSPGAAVGYALYRWRLSEQLRTVAAKTGPGYFVALAAGHGWKDLAIWVMPAAVYALASDTLIGVVRAWVLARQRVLARIDDLPLFGAAAAPPPKASAVEEALKEVEPDALSPKQALEILYSLKKKLPLSTNHGRP